MKTNLRQRKAFQALAENGGRLGDAMRKAGYSEAVAKSPSKVTNSKNWQDLMDEFLPDSELAKVHKDLLGDESYRARVSALDMAYKLKGNYAAQKMEVSKKLSDMSDEELQQLIDEEQKKIGK